MKVFFDRYKIEAGCDEAGRGCLAGPVFAAAVILPKTFRHPYLTDSKKLSESQRYKLRDVIEKKAISWAVNEISPTKIDEINILRASILGMNISVDQLLPQPELLLIDGNRYYPHNEIPFKCIIEGDAIYMSIAAASVLAKTYRDDLMKKLHHEFPQYCWDKNKGYPTTEHKRGIKEFGITPYHRRSFRLFEEEIQSELF